MLQIVFQQKKFFLCLLLTVCCCLTSCQQSLKLDSVVPDILAADSIQIESRGSDHLHDSSIKYSLHREENRFQGQLVGSLKKYPNGCQAKIVEDIEIPLDAVQEFLKRMAAVQLEDKSVARSTAMDGGDHSLSIKIKEKNITFTNRNQETRNFVTNDGKQYTTKLLDDEFVPLTPYLQERDVWTGLQRRCQQEK